MLNKPLKSLFLLLLLGFIWGTGYSIAHFATTNGVTPLGYSFWQSLGPALLIGLLALKNKKSSTNLSVSNFRYYLICGLFGIVIPNTNMYFSAAHLPAGLLAVIVNTVPIIAYSMALWLRIESFHWTRFLGIGCAVSGLMLMILPSASLPSPEMIPWILTTLITPISFAFCSIYIAKYRPAGSQSIQLAAGTLIFSSIILTPLVLFSKNFYSLHFPLTAPDAVILLEILLSSAGYILYFQLIKLAGPVYYSLVDTVVAMTGLFWGYLLFHETLATFTLAAVILILFALLLVTKHLEVMLKYPLRATRSEHAEEVLTQPR